MPVEQRGQVIAVELGPTGSNREGPRFHGRRQPSCDDTSRMNREVSAKGTDTLFLDRLCHIRTSLCRSAFHGVTRDGPLASKRQTEVLWPGLRRKRAAPIASIAACHACAEEPIRFTCTGSRWRVLTR